MKFQPGHSGNPGGRRPSLTKTIQRKCGRDGQKLIGRLWALALDPKVATRDQISAMKILAEHGWSKPPQALEHSGTEGGPIRVTFGGRYKPEAA